MVNSDVFITEPGKGKSLEIETSTPKEAFAKLQPGDELKLSPPLILDQTGVTLGQIPSEVALLIKENLSDLKVFFVGHKRNKLTVLLKSRRVLFTEEETPEPSLTLPNEPDLEPEIPSP